MKPPPYFSVSEPQRRLSDPAQPHKLCRRRRRSHGPLSICFSCKGKHLEGRKYYYYCATCKLEFHRGCHLLPPVIRHPFHPSHLLTLISLPPGFDISKIPRNTDDGSAASERSINETDDDDDSEDGGHDDEDNNFVDDDVIVNDGDGVGEDRDGDSDGDGDGGDDDDDDDFQQDIYYRVNGYDYYYNNYDDGDNAAYASISDGNDHRKCKCCQDPLKKVHYHCSICKFNLNLSCSMRPPPPTISHLKSHEHTLTLFPIRLPSPCDACGLSLSDTIDLIYACLPCSHMIHRSCIYLPRVIQITRHPHRLSLTSSLQVGDFSCGVCRQTVDINYGHYSCNKGCNYAVHSKCATREDVWDGKDLEGVPEKPDEDIEPFVRIDEETIQHFSHHEHYMKLHEKETISEKDKFCEACTLPVMISQRYYGCTECDFVLDEACASLPRKIYNPLHKHPLTLQPFPIDETSNIADNISTKGIFECDGCHRLGCGFVYRCSKRKCVFRLDVRCASLPDPFIHDCHPHDLFFNLTKGNCIGCGSDECSSYFLECIKCNSFLGIRCASLPFEAHYKHDRHPLILCRDEDTSSGLYWCEICESELDPKTWFYTCDFCTITLHVNCLLGKDMYMKPQYIFKIGYRHRKVEIARNDGNSRLFCTRCKRHCMQNLIYKRIGRDQSYCTLKCFGARLMQELF